MKKFQLLRGPLDGWPVEERLMVENLSGDITLGLVRMTTAVCDEQGEEWFRFTWWAPVGAGNCETTVRYVTDDDDNVFWVV